MESQTKPLSLLFPAISKSEDDEEYEPNLRDGAAGPDP